MVMPSDQITAGQTSSNTMPTYPSGSLEQRLKEWEGKGSKYSSLAEMNRQQMLSMQSELQKIPTIPVLGGSTRVPTRSASNISSDISTMQQLPPELPSLELPNITRYNLLNERLQSANRYMDKLNYYQRFYYQGWAIIASGQDALGLIPKDVFSDEEMASLKVDAESIKAAFEGREPLPDMAKDSIQPDMPELKPPTPVSYTPVSVHSLTQRAIQAALTTPARPDPILAKKEWEQHLYAIGKVENIGDTISLQQQAQEFVKEWQDDNAKREAGRAGLVQVPDWKAVDLLREVWFQPGLAIADAAGWYSEHVSAPIAGAALSWLIPDMNSAYQKYTKTNSEWLALGQAFRNWDHNWALKMGIEIFFDPLSYIGIGIATKITKPLPYLGRFVGATERGWLTIADAPFAAIKYGLAKLPTTVTQRATTAGHTAGQYMEKAITAAYKRPFNRITMKEWKSFSEKAVEYVKQPKNAMLENDMAEAGRQLLKHTPFNKEQIQSWLPKLKSTLTANDISRQTVDNVNNLFEDFFTCRTVTAKEAGARLAGILDGQVDDAAGVATKMLESRAKFIESKAMELSKAETQYKALQKLVDRNFKIHDTIERSEQFLAREEMGRMQGFLTDIPITVQRVWSTYIDKTIVSPLARAYLVFGMYGPMNVMEDIGRSALGGVLPRFAGRDSFDRAVIGLSVDQSLIQNRGISEMYGILREGEKYAANNWPLQLLTLGNKKWADKIYTGLVRVPGAYSMDVRRGFILGRYYQELARLGGDVVEQLAKAGPQELKLSSSRLSKMIQREVYQAKLSGDSSIVRELQGVFTRKNINKMEVQNTLLQHPDLPNDVRSFILKAHDNDQLFKDGIKSINERISAAGDVLLDDFIHSPELAARQFEALAKTLTEVQVANPEQLAYVLRDINTMSEIYGGTRKQILSVASRRSRGLPFDKRRPMMDKALDDVAAFEDRAIKSMRDVRENLKQQMQGGRTTISRYFKETTDVPFYDTFLKNPKYAEGKGYQVYVVQMSPDEYLKQTAKMQGTSLPEQARMVESESLDRYIFSS